MAEWIINLGEAAEYMFDHNIFQENLVGVDFCARMVGETNPGVLELANRTECPHAAELDFCLRRYAATNDEQALQIVRVTLARMKTWLSVRFMPFRIPSISRPPSSSPTSGAVRRR